LQKENTEGYIEYLKSIDWLDEAAKRLVNIIDDDGYVSKEGKSKHQVREIISSNTLIYFKFGLL
jgi:pre-mRNA-splicing factor SYF1